ncbi:cytochrome b561 domain-containing protein At2g30890-like isoform X2 [Alnus glutinosa]|uniref:cytochrome b561 domain-containing protein At2g30890-like isoform X2 n=1 Tax=Alnus glutinosa TaxID=3517 RepID=UPI002D7955F9|nr:cytochrome b561 domain-containing protein At2g30890-like isoform X2 [Alnus glutinosa]
MRIQLLLQNLVSFTIHASVFVLVLFLPLVSSSQEHSKATTHAGNKDYHSHKSQKLLFEITLHGFLLWASLGFLMPVGILVIRMSNREECGRRLKILFYVHAILQTLMVLLATAGAVMSIKNFNNSFNNYHQRIGVALYAIIWLQALVGFVRPKRGSKARSVWFFAHWLLGTSVSLLGVLNIYTGLQAYHEKTSRSIRLWTIIFTAEMSFIAFFYLLQDKWVYTKKQGVILGDEPKRPIDQHTSPSDTQKELVVKSC